MSAKVDLEIEINESGETSVKVSGDKGPKCLDWMEVLEKVLGKVSRKEMTSEYYEVKQKTGATIKTRQ